MKKSILILFILLACASMVQAGVTMMMGGGVEAVGGPYCTQNFTDNFDRSNSTTVGVTYTESVGDWSVNTNRLQVTLADVVGRIINSTALGGIVQYGKVTYVTLSAIDGSAGILLRTKSDLSVFYFIQCDVSGTVWEDVSGSIAGPVSPTCASGDNFSVIVTGTGTNTVVSAWKNTTANIPWSGGTHCTDTAKPCWDNAGDAPDVQFTENPTTASNSELGWGIVAYKYASGDTVFDNAFFGYCGD